MADIADLVEAMAKYRADTAQAKVKVKSEMEDRVLELTLESRTALSRLVHEAHAGGMTKAEINAVLGVYSNAPQAAPIWNAFTPSIATDLRYKSTVAPAENPSTVLDNGDVVVTLDSGLTVTVVGAVLHEDGDAQWVEFDAPSVEELDEDYPQVYTRVLAALQAQQKGEEDAGSSS